ncbi:hypothetical protein KHU12_26215, partial [Pseudocitrobacter faecalis]|uniref:hypothetical protein n=1 Tax=Pseudocitrobacter faecalis TaxID=1398493 RepID=UPI0033158A51
KNDGNTIFLNSVRTTALSVKNALVNRTDFSINLKDCGDPDGKIRDTNDGTWDIYKYQVSYVNPTNSSATAGHVAANATYEIS